MKTERLTDIVFCLLKDERVTAKELANRFGVSLRTIYRDIDALSLAGVPVYTDRGNGGGISIDGQYRLTSAVFSEDEKQQLLAILEAFCMQSGGVAEKLFYKLSGMFKADSGAIEVDFSDWHNNNFLHQCFELLRRSIYEQFVVHIDYIDADGICSDRDVEPLKLIYKFRDWYLYAYCRVRGENRMFKISRIYDISKTNIRFCRTCDECNITQNIEWNGDNVDVTLKFAAEAVNRVMETYRGFQFERTEDGGMIVTNRMPKDCFLLSYILSFGDLVEVISPLDLREEIRCIHERAAKLKPS